jgi:hypothetical protein
MSDGNWTNDRPQDDFSGTGTGTSGEQNIVDGTAEVVSETVGEPAYTAAHEEAQTYYRDPGQASEQASGRYESYQAGNSSAGSEYAHADAGSATGNGSYQYSASHEYYQGENYGSSVGGGQGPSSGGGRGKGFLAVALAIVFGVCIGAGFWGVHRYLGNSGAADTAIAGAAENSGQVVSGEKTEEPKALPGEAAQAEAPAEAAAEPEAEAPAQAETPAAAAPEETQNCSLKGASRLMQLTVPKSFAR